jgi:hypothetical protein
MLNVVVTRDEIFNIMRIISVFKAPNLDGFYVSHGTGNKIQVVAKKIIIYKLKKNYISYKNLSKKKKFDKKKN